MSSISTNQSVETLIETNLKQQLTPFATQFLNDNDLFNISNQLPTNLKTRLFDIFGQIEKEFELLCLDNLRLRAKLSDDPLTTANVESTLASSVSPPPPPTPPIAVLSTSPSQPLTVNCAISPLYQQQANKYLISPNATTTITTIKARNTTIFPKFTNNLMQTIKNSSSQNVNTSTSSSTANNYNANSLLQPSISTFKEQYQIESRLKQTLIGHKDGILDINCVQLPDMFLKNLFDMKSLYFNNSNNLSTIQHASSNLLIGTASADYSSRLWLLNFNQQHQQQSGFCIQQYVGHQGSVNSLRFHPKFNTNNLILTASGDTQAHIWQFLLPIETSANNTPVEQLPLKNSNPTQLLINDDLVNSLYSYYSNYSNYKISNQFQDGSYSCTDNLLRTPLNRYKSHTDACIAADWLPDGDHIVTASWDRTSNIYNVESAKVICTLTHDDQLTNLNIHSNYNLILTSSRDTTFKLWDIRVKQQSINIYHGHTRSVNSAIFLYENPTNHEASYNRIATASDDHTCKIWDLRQMKQAQCQINLNSSINRICTKQNLVTNEVVLCLPLDNRDIKIYSLNGERLTRLQRSSRVGHKRMVTSICSQNNLLLSASFDKQAICWSVDYNPISKQQKSTTLVQQQQSVTKSTGSQSNNILTPTNTNTLPSTTNPQQIINKTTSSSNMTSPASPKIKKINDNDQEHSSPALMNFSGKKDLFNNKKMGNSSEQRIKI